MADNRKLARIVEKIKRQYDICPLSDPLSLFEQGIEKGEVALFLKMLKLKFDSLPDSAKEKIAQADAKTIETWAAKMLKAQTLAEVFE